MQDKISIVKKCVRIHGKVHYIPYTIYTFYYIYIKKASASVPTSAATTAASTATATSISTMKIGYVSSFQIVSDLFKF